MREHNTTRRRSLSLSIALVIAATLPCFADSRARSTTANGGTGLDLGELNPFGWFSGNRFTGTWYLATRIGSPTILTLSTDGTFTATDGLGFGGASGPLPPPEGDRFEEPASPVQGVWVRIDWEKFTAVGLRMKSNRDGKVLSVVRLRYECNFDGDFEKLACTFTREPFPCKLSTIEPVPGVLLTDIPSCPDPNAQALRTGLPIHTMGGSRLRIQLTAE